MDCRQVEGVFFHYRLLVRFSLSVMIFSRIQQDVFADSPDLVEWISSRWVSVRTSLSWLILFWYFSILTRSSVRTSLIVGCSTLRFTCPSTIRTSFGCLSLGGREPKKKVTWGDKKQPFDAKKMVTDLSAKQFSASEQMGTQSEHRAKRFVCQERG